MYWSKDELKALPESEANGVGFIGKVGMFGRGDQIFSRLHHMMKALT